MTEWLLLCAALGLVGANAVFVAAEFAFITVDRASVDRRAEEGDVRAASLAKALRSLSTQLSGAQLGITVTSLAVGWLAEPAIAELIRGPLQTLGIGGGEARGLSLTVALALATSVQMVLGELVPKNWAIAEPMRVGRWVAGAQRTFTLVARWPIRVLNGAANAVLRLLGIEPTEELASARSPQELSSMVRRSALEGKLDDPTAGLLARSLDLTEQTAADVMTPRPQVQFVTAEEPVLRVRDLTAETGLARFPVLGDSVDDVVGLVHFKHALAVPADERAQTPVREVMVPVRAVPDSMGVEHAFDTLRAPGLQMAVVIDEYGGTAGILTLEDLVEEVLGEIEDEHDPQVPRHRQLDDTRWQVSGLMRPDELSDVAGVSVPEAEQAETLGGLIMERLGRLPEVDDHVDVHTRDVVEVSEALPDPATLRLTVRSLDGRRVDELEVEVLRPAEDGEDGEGDD